MISFNVEMPTSCSTCPLISTNPEGKPMCFWNKRILLESQLDKRSGFCDLIKEKEAYWEEGDDNPEVTKKIWFCSGCGANALGVYEKTRYCPDCGARMR